MESGEQYGLRTFQWSKLYLIVLFLARPSHPHLFRQLSVQIELSGCPAATCRLAAVQALEKRTSKTTNRHWERLKKQKNVILQRFAVNCIQLSVYWQDQNAHSYSRDRLSKLNSPAAPCIAAFQTLDKRTLIIANQQWERLKRQKNDR